MSQVLRKTVPMIDPRLKALASRIRDAINGSPYTAADVARHLEVDKSAVSRWMKGERTPTMKNLIDLADLLQKELDELWTGPVSTPTTPEQQLMLTRMAEMTPEQQQALLSLAATMGKPIDK